MFPLWDVAIAPVITASGAKRVVEIGALRGENTVQVLDVLGPDGEIHVIDPLPGFDPEEHAKQFGGRYIFHEALSLDVLRDIPAADVALIDGDHNWYTVYNECKQLAEVARAAGQSMPVMVLHDVLWPYGRRDLYYDPSNVPADQQQPHAQQGMRPGGKRLLSKGGVNSALHNALVEGGPRNGVMTGLEDFIKEYDRPLRHLVLPIYFGLSIVVEEEQLERQPELAQALDRLESAEGRFELMEVAEANRLKAVFSQHNTMDRDRGRVERATARFLSTVKASLLNEHYLDHEARFTYLAKQAKAGGNVDPVILRDPTRHQNQPWKRLQEQRLGTAGPSPSAERSFAPYTAMGRHRLDYIESCLDRVRETKVSGALVDVGTGRGGAALFMRAYLDGHEMADHHVWVVDRFRASHDDETRPPMPDSGVAGFRADLNLVRDGFDRFGYLDDDVSFVQGPVGPALKKSDTGDIALLRMGHTILNDTAAVLEATYDRVVDGGFVVIELGGSDKVMSAIETFRSERGITSPLHRIDDKSVSWQRHRADEQPAVASAHDTSTEGAALIPRPSRVATDPVDLTVVVVFYNMKREAARTLRSLSRAYQEQLGDATYEVLAIENGSAAEQRLGSEFVESFGPEFRYIDMGDSADPSPVTALNRGVIEGRGDAFALMIDGAHVVTPGVIHYGLLGLRAYAPAIVSTQQWYVGPGQQGEAMDNGYDEAYEDRLFDSIGWPSTGYKLFEIGHFISDRDWLDGMWESNCLFATREQLAQVGAFSEAFAMPGGGYANLELYERLAASPDVSVVTMIGEGSFHQSHGGTTTNQPDPAERRSRVFSYGQHYADLTGRPFAGPGKPIHYVGRFSIPAANRTRPRRMSAQRFTDAASAGVDGPPTTPSPVPQELSTSFLEAVWDNMPWVESEWRGHQVSTPPTDLFAFQQLIERIRPDVVVETCEAVTGRSFFLADVCAAIGHGRVVSISATGGASDHERLDVLHGSLADAATRSALEELSGGGTAFAVLGARRDRAGTVAEFDAIAPSIPVGSFVVVADTIVNGNPVWTGFGPGPAEAVKNILRRHGSFVQDDTIQTYSLSFNPGGFLRRVAD